MCDLFCLVLFMCFVSFFIILFYYLFSLLFNVVCFVFGKVLALADQQHFSVKGLVVFGRKMQTGGVFLQSIWLFAREVHV